jgi:hypothetical protein
MYIVAAKFNRKAPAHLTNFPDNLIDLPKTGKSVS